MLGYLKSNFNQKEWVFNLISPIWTSPQCQNVKEDRRKQYLIKTTNK
jgi:hypothetical protein